MYENIEKDVVKVIQYSQGIEDPKLGNLFTNWRENKKFFIERFGNKLIYTYPNKISVKLTPEEKNERLKSFIFQVKYIHFYSILGEFIEQQGSESFFENKVSQEAYATNGTLIKTGTKLIKAFKHYIDSPTKLREIQDEASRLIQEDRVEGYLCFSVHPLDYLSMSDNTYNWHSCHSLKGEFRAGNLSYMQDPCTIVCYLRSEIAENKIPNFPEDILWNSKKWRMVLYMSEDHRMIFAGRQYPFDSSALMDVVYNNPNKLTIKAMKEAKEERELETLNSENLETLINSL